MKHWTKNEVKTAKIEVSVKHKMGKVNVESNKLVLRPREMDPEDYNILLELFITYGKPK